MLRLWTLSTAFICLLWVTACNQGGEEVHVKKGASAHDAANATEHEAGRYDLSYKNEKECKTNQGSWDSEESECYVMCMAPNTFDKSTSKCEPFRGTDESGHEPGRHDLSYKTKAECETKHGKWDDEDGECYVICLPPDSFDEAASACKAGEGSESGDTSTMEGMDHTENAENSDKH